MAGLILPAIIAIIAGDAIVAEADWRTLGYVLTARWTAVGCLPPSSSPSWLFSVIAALATTALALIAGAVLFPVGALHTIPGVAEKVAPTLVPTGPTLSVGTAVFYILVAASVAGVQVAGLAAAGVAISTVTRVPLGAVAATLLVLGISQSLQASVAFLNPVHPWLLNTYWSSLTNLFHSGFPCPAPGGAWGCS